MIISPEFIKFENKEDVIDYVTLGLPPTKKNYEKVVSIMERGQIDEVHPSNSIYFDNNDKVFKEAMDRIYGNRIRNRNTAIVIVGCIILGLIFRKYKSGKKEND